MGAGRGAGKSRQRLSAFLLRHGLSYPGKSNWTLAHWRWFEEQGFAQLLLIVFREYVDTVKVLGLRLQALEQLLVSESRDSVFWPVIESLMALRGIDLVTARTVVVEVGDPTSFASAPQLMAYLGLVPSEYSSGTSKKRGPASCGIASC